MPGQILDLVPEPSERLDDGVLEVEADLAQVALERVLRIDPFEMVHDLREAIDLRGLERQHFADVTRGAAAAIRDHVRRHGYSWPFGAYSWPFGAYSWPFGA